MMFYNLRSVHLPGLKPRLSDPHCTLESQGPTPGQQKQSLGMAGHQYCKSSSLGDSNVQPGLKQLKRWRARKCLIEECVSPAQCSFLSRVLQVISWPLWQVYCLEARIKTGLLKPRTFQGPDQTPIEDFNKRYAHSFSFHCKNFPEHQR